MSTFLLTAAVACGAAVVLLARPQNFKATAVIGLVMALTICGIFTLACKTAPAVYELETGEYLRCTPEDGNTLTCKIAHR